MLDINKFLNKYYKKDEKIILACSTWPDSMFLLYKILESDFKNNLVACYFNHKLRIESDDEQHFLKKLWKKMWFKVEIWEANIKKIRDSFPLSISIEELARQKRYIFLKKMCKIHNTKKIITWHHMDDKIETFFFNLARWSKLTWLINMTENNWNILRPLLWIEKKEIINYLEENNLKYFIDKSNYSNEYSRNLIRNKIIPEFYNINSNFKKNIINTLNYFEDLKNHIDGEVINFLWDKNYFEKSAFNSLSDFLQKEVIRYIFFISNWNSTIWLSNSNINEIIKFINWKWNKTIKEIKGLKMKKDWNKIFFKSEF